MCYAIYSSLALLYFSPSLSLHRSTTMPCLSLAHTLRQRDVCIFVFHNFSLLFNVHTQFILFFFRLFFFIVWFSIFFRSSTHSLGSVGVVLLLLLLLMLGTMCSCTMYLHDFFYLSSSSASSSSTSFWWSLLCVCFFFAAVVLVVGRTHSSISSLLP